MGGPKDSATSQQGLAPVAVVVAGDTVRRESDRSGAVTPSNGGSMRGGLHASMLLRQGLGTHLCLPCKDFVHLLVW